ncbi:uncharacterized protein LOC126664869 [Mercurialis annua]|uniref:uncharacterized protein LOC126664869 n=1 Tax=Mercurialis annua TaxID=3986 RepID=UPI00215FA7DA|nr:uncharacterized protein LOC126664869 [Mercurialis annua]
MIEKSKKRKKGIVSEGDISTLLQRYTANTVLALLQEVAQFEGVKIDWNALVKKTTTGICNVREYQMLWRHLAYRHALLDQLDDAAQPLDDDSDLEYELEAFPSVSSDASAEATACVKVLIASGSPSDSTHQNSSTVEAPLMINIPNGQPVRETSENSQPAIIRGVNITVPVSVQKQSGGSDTNGSTNGNFPPRRKRIIWTKSEDAALIAAVQKHGVGNWAHILRCELNWDRTASQISQRWTNITKKNGNLNTVAVSNTSGVQLSETQRAARIALNLALDPPTRNTFTNNSGEATSSQFQAHRSFGAKSSLMVSLSSATKSQLAVKKPPIPDLSSDPVRATAVAAGARIATQSDAASLLKAAQAKNAVHIMPTGGSSIKSSLSGGSANHSEARPSVHVNDVAAASRSTLTAVSTSGTRPVSTSTTQQTSIVDTARSMSAKQSNAELPSNKDTETAGRIQFVPGAAEQQIKKEPRACVSGNDNGKQNKAEKTALPNNGSLKLEVAESDTLNVVSKQVEGSQNSKGDMNFCLSVKKEENQSGVQVTDDNGNMADKPDRTNIATDKCSGKLEAVNKPESDIVMKEVEG